MTESARELLAAVQRELAPHDDENRLVHLIAGGTAPRSVFRLIAAEEHHIVASDWRSFLHLAARSTERNAREFFAGLAQGEGVALEKLAALNAATGLDDEALREYEPLAGCQAYPAYLAWLALNGDPADVVVAITANFAAWGSYCATIAEAMREHYGFDDDACGFFDLFASPPEPGADALPVAAVRAGIEAGRGSREARRYARLFQSYELQFWNTLADQPG
ncbi:transcriptional regulator [Amycolatopsis anabasis]|uniref:transcriptional regulator n=1 Tax=Amycolatopsis anabasis TaxID=1840409 RepID=UPI00131CDDE2|nr:transcriptional regulator [Amycolatopsis anabasis]